MPSRLHQNILTIDSQQPNQDKIINDTIRPLLLFDNEMILWEFIHQSILSECVVCLIKYLIGASNTAEG